MWVGGCRRCAGGAWGDFAAGVGEDFCELLPAHFGEEEGGWLLLEALGAGEVVGTGADHHDVGGVLHDGAREGDGVTGEVDGGDGAGGEGVPFMRAASISLVPSDAKAAPRPALKRGSSSRTSTAASTASSEEPLRLRTAVPAARAVAREC